MHVGSIAMEVVDMGRRGNAAQATIRIVNGNGQPVHGATVSGRWTGLAKGTSTETTNANGYAVMTSRHSKKNGTFTITVTDVTLSGSSYDPSANVATTMSITVP